MIASPDFDPWVETFSARGKLPAMCLGPPPPVSASRWGTHPVRFQEVIGFEKGNLTDWDIYQDPQRDAFWRPLNT